MGFASPHPPYRLTPSPIRLPHAAVRMAERVKDDAASTEKTDVHVDVGDVESSNGAAVVIADTARVLDHKAERKLCRKFDVRILPVLAIMCKSTRYSDRMSPLVAIISSTTACEPPSDAAYRPFQRTR